MHKEHTFHPLQDKTVLLWYGCTANKILHMIQYPSIRNLHANMYMVKQCNLEHVLCAYRVQT